MILFHGGLEMSAKDYLNNTFGPDSTEDTLEFPGVLELAEKDVDADGKWVATTLYYSNGFYIVLSHEEYNMITSLLEDKK